jgi:ligand-binding SRPBCC domain-containing protein
MARIHLETEIAAAIERVFDLARDIDFHQRSMAYSGERAVAGRTSGLIGAGESVSWRARHFGMTWSLTSRVTELEPPVMFVDEQVSGPFASFRHAHRFKPTPAGTLMIDDWEHRPRFGLLGRILDGLILVRSCVGCSNDEPQPSRAKPRAHRTRPRRAEAASGTPDATPERPPVDQS